MAILNEREPGEAVSQEQDAVNPALSDELYEERRLRRICALVVDFETTGTDTDKDRVVQYGSQVVQLMPALPVDGALNWTATISPAGSRSQLFNPGIDIPPGASAVHHIVDGMVANAPSHEELYALIKLDVHSGIVAVVGHNIIDFDLKFAPYLRSGEFGRPVLDTLRLAKKAWPNLEKYSNQYLRYALPLIDPRYSAFLPEPGTMTNAHDALADCVVTAGIFACIINTLVPVRGETVDIAYLEKLQMEPNLLKVVPFGKYRGKTFEEVARIDRSYFRWALQNMKDLDDDLRHTMTHHLNS